MRIWHEKLIPKLCRQHLLACWREGLGAYKIITEDKKGYRNHPAVKEFETRTAELWLRLNIIRNEMLKRGYKPKEMPEFDYSLPQKHCQEWQTLEEQTEILKNKHCDCEV
jgi:uncharacterized protein (TIGR02328 family)